MGEGRRRQQARANGVVQPAPQVRSPVSLVVSDAAPVATDPVRDFKAERRMFAHVRGELRVARVGDRRFHREWLSDVSEDEFRRVVRGYYLQPDVVFYRGGFDGVSRRHVDEILPKLREAMDLPDETVIHSGARPVGHHDDLVGRHAIGTVGPWLARLADGARGEPDAPSDALTDPGGDPTR